MTDARTDALTAPTADPGIVHALVYVGDQIAANATERASNRLLADDGAERELVDTPTPTDDVARYLRALEAAAPADRDAIVHEFMTKQGWWK